jgi:hypothetical protein
MAWTTEIKWIFPPNWDGNPSPDGKQGWREVEAQLTGLATATEEETNVKKVDISELRMPDGTIPTRTVVRDIVYDNNGLTSLRLDWDRSPKALIARLPGDGEGCIKGPLTDPGDGLNNGEGDTGDILLTTVGGSSGDSYLISLKIKLKNSYPSFGDTDPAT